MPIFASAFIALTEAGVPFLVIGGHAVVFAWPRTEILKIQSCRRLFLNMEDPERSPRSRDASLGCENPDWLNLPTPREPLRAWTEIEPGVMIAEMETLMQLVKSEPDFEARRLARKSAVKFRY